jgi:hypothetical protein
VGSNWLREISVSGDSAANSISPIQEATQNPTVCNEDCGCLCNLCPCTYAVVEGLILQRNIAGANIPLVVDAGTGAQLLSTGNLNFPFAGGLRSYIGHRFSDCRAWEVGYFGVYGANASTTVTGPGNLALPADFAGLNVFFGADQVATNYTSNLNGMEFNLANCCSCCDGCGCHSGGRSSEWLYGFRYLRIDDSLNIAAQNAGVGGIEQGSYDVRAANNLYGGQIGNRLRRCWGLWSIEGTGKAGLYYNDASQRQTVVDFPGVLVRQTSSSDNRLAFLGELNASLIRQITDHWYVRGGYNLIWIDGVALAPNQLDFTLTATSGTATNSGARALPEDSHPGRRDAPMGG